MCSASRRPARARVCNVLVAMVWLGGCGHPQGQGPPGADAGEPPADADMPPPESIYSTLISVGNDRFVAAGGSDADPLAAGMTAAAEATQFEIIDGPDGTISLRSRVNQRFVAPDLAQDGQLSARSQTMGSAETFSKQQLDDGTFALKATANGQYVSVLVNQGAVLHANRPMVAGAWERFIIGKAPRVPPPDLGPNVLLFDPSMPPTYIQRRVDQVFAKQQGDDFGPGRYALAFRSGSYDADVNVGFYTQALGLGRSPDDVVIHGNVHAEADWFNGNATLNFWRAAENLAVVPAGGSARWAVSQAAPFRRMHVKGSLVLDDGGWASGGLIADSVIDGEVDSGTQQQWLSRSSQIGSWTGSNWNMVFTGVVNAPADGQWPHPPYTTVDRAPLVREKPFLFVDAYDRYGVFVPSLRSDGKGASWSGGEAAGKVIPVARFHVAIAGKDSAATLNAALSAGEHLLFTPGVYHLNDTLRVEHANTVVLGLGIATLVADGGVIAMQVADVDGVAIAGLLFDAGATSSPVLLEVGPPASAADHAANPISLHDLFFRVGGAGVGRAKVSLSINSDDVLGDHFWIWRADHGDGVGWDTNTTTNGLVVNGDNVTIYGLFVEHYHQYQTLWNGEDGRVYFYQSEIPYDVPDQASWMNGGMRGFASYKVAASVTRHEVWGLGIYCLFNDNPSVKLGSAIEAPSAPGVKLHHMVTVSLGGGRGEITHVVNGVGDAANPSSTVANLGEYP